MNKAKFLENLTEARKSRGLTQKQAAQAIGVSDKTYSKWETGENEPDIGALCRLGEFYGEGPDLFFREGEKPAPLEGLGVEEAAEACFQKVSELLLSLRCVRYPRPDSDLKAPLPVPAKPIPEELWAQIPDLPNNLWHYSYRDLLALIASGSDANLALLMLPHEERYHWLETEGEGLETLFRLLGMPGAVRCLYGMLTEQQGSLYSPAYLAEKTGISEEEAAAFLAEAENWELSSKIPYLRQDGPAAVYSGGLRVQLLGILTLGRLLLSRGPLRGELRGLIISGNGNVTLPTGKGGDP